MRTVSGAALLASSLAGTSAFANGRFPAAGQLVFNPEDPSLIAVRATFGVIISKDSGKSWDWICEKAMGYGDSIEDPAIAITAGPGLLVATQEGLARSADGCGWTLFPQLGFPAMDIVVKRDDTKSAIALTSANGPADSSGQPTYINQLYLTTDSGAQWAKLGAALEPALLVQTVEIAKSDPLRVYVSGTAFRADGADGVILTSKDGGKTFARHTFPLADDEVAPFLAAVDPTNADRVYIRVSGKPASRLVVSDDGATTFKDKFTTTGPMLGFAVSEDGSKVYAGSIEDGMFAASSADLSFKNTSKTQIQCLTVKNGKIYACSNENSGFALGTSTNDGATFTPLLHLGCIRGAITCSDPDASASVCAADFTQVLQPTLGVCGPAASDGGTEAGAADDGGTTSSPDASAGSGGSKDAGGPGNGDTGGGGGGGESGCTTTPGGTGSVGAAFAIGLALLGLRIRKSRKGSSS